MPWPTTGTTTGAGRVRSLVVSSRVPVKAEAVEGVNATSTLRVSPAAMTVGPGGLTRASSAALPAPRATLCKVQALGPTLARINAPVPTLPTCTPPRSNAPGVTVRLHPLGSRASAVRGTLSTGVSRSALTSSRLPVCWPAAVGA
jgi:hypothetical protein